MKSRGSNLFSDDEERAFQEWQEKEEREKEEFIKEFINSWEAQKKAKRKLQIIKNEINEPFYVLPKRNGGFYIIPKDLVDPYTYKKKHEPSKAEVIACNFLGYGCLGYLFLSALYVFAVIYNCLNRIRRHNWNSNLKNYRNRYPISHKNRYPINPKPSFYWFPCFFGQMVIIPFE
ncbi:MAG: hypothetical protein F6K40_37180 [Okeania sp. SIO3I5]|uniref:hypothetical protein n=1 Tax=Okeania sp. SIO3I5 TaxID=2607805 RepID=UPI0013BE44B3|nr:hypothetical protein [Okeania sp. SIO3I5]NEQ41528.1 hypothetical protein [Okeania sp. SIO3I5]